MWVSTFAAGLFTMSLAFVYVKNLMIFVMTSFWGKIFAKKRLFRGLSAPESQNLIPKGGCPKGGHLKMRCRGELSVEKSIRSASSKSIPQGSTV